VRADVAVVVRRAARRLDLLNTTELAIHSSKLLLQKRLLKRPLKKTTTKKDNATTKKSAICFTDLLRRARKAWIKN
jgi:hypothetical protein